MTETTSPALQAPIINLLPGPEYADAARVWQGIPGIERAANGRLWALCYSGGTGEGPENYVVLVTSGDDGQTWSPPVLVIDPPGQVRAYDPALWHDPLGRLWLFWAQSKGWFDGRCGVWAICCDDATGPTPAWSAPRRLGHGIMMNKPTVLSTGEWLLPASVWVKGGVTHPDVPAAERRANVLASTDQGETWTWRGGAEMPDRIYDEHMIVERRDGCLWMLARTVSGIGETVSRDGGHTWGEIASPVLPGPCSRFFLRRLRSGRLLLVNHYQFTGRNNLTAMLSDDDGRTWYGHLRLDERAQVSYPDGVEAEDGRLYLIYDFERHGAQEILLAVVTEDDIAHGEIVTPGSRLRVLVNKAGGG